VIHRQLVPGVRPEGDGGRRGRRMKDEG
jgi:hypothetical protein